jgi:uncharacterized protein (DUF1810 family)
MADFDIVRFLNAQDSSFDKAHEEMLSGRKVGHWMWFIFPQLRGLGQSVISNEYGISGLREAEVFFNHEILGFRYRQLLDVLLKSRGSDPKEIFGHVDAMKFRSALTLFSLVDNTEAQLPRLCLEKYFYGIPDEITLNMLIHNE